MALSMQEPQLYLRLECYNISILISFLMAIFLLSIKLRKKETVCMCACVYVPARFKVHTNDI